MTNSIIKPTVGRVVWFRPSPNSVEPSFIRHNDGQPYAATIARVWNDALVNLTVFDANGFPHSRTSVPLLQAGGGGFVPVGMYCEWMPYQKGQAAKAEAAEKELAQEPQGFHPTQRQQLEYALVSGAASHLAQVPKQAGEIASDIKVVLNELYPEPVLTNPHTGAARDSRDVASDPQATLCVKPGDPRKTAPIALSVIDPGPDSLEREIQAKAGAVATSLRLGFHAAQLARRRRGCKRPPHARPR